MNKADRFFFRKLEIPEGIKTFYYKDKVYTREELIEIQNKLNEKN